MPTVVPQRTLRRLAPRFIRVLNRRAAASPALASFAKTGVPKAEAFIKTYDKCQIYAADWKKEMAEGRGAVVSLVAEVRSWLPQVKRDVPGFDSSTFVDRPEVPDDVLEDAERLLSTIQEYRDAQGQPLPYQTEAAEGLTRALQAATKEWTEAEAADSDYQRLLASVRELAAVMQSELVALRRTLTVVVGRSDKDYQKLRVERGAFADEDDDPNAPPPSPPVEAAPAAVAPPATA